MKAMVCTKYGPPDVLQLREVETPVPGDYEVLVRICAAAVTSSDCFVRGMNLSALYRFAARIALGFSRPRQPILGMVFAGEVESIGRNVSLFKRGDWVFGMDRYALSSRQEALQPLPLTEPYVPYLGIRLFKQSLGSRCQHICGAASHTLSRFVRTFPMSVCSFGFAWSACGMLPLSDIDGNS